MPAIAILPAGLTATARYAHGGPAGAVIAIAIGVLLLAVAMVAGIVILLTRGRRT